MTPLEDLVRTLTPPLEYLVGAPHQISPAALPLKTIHEKLARASGGARDAPVQETLTEIAASLDRLATEPSVALVRRVLELLAKLDAAPAASSARPAYIRSTAPARPQLEALRMSVQYVKGVGPKRGDQLAKFGLSTVDDLLFHLPFRYEDRRDVRTIAKLRPGEEATLEAVLEAPAERWAGRGRRKILEVIARDETGALSLVWYNKLRYFHSRFRAGQRVLLHGRVEPLRQAALARGLAPLRMVHPEVELLDPEEHAELGRIVPVYTKPAGISAGAIRRVVHSAVDAYAARVPSAIPAALARVRGIADLASALRDVHQPAADADVDALNAATSPAHRSIVYDELFYLQLGMALKKSTVAREEGIAFRVPAARAERLVAALPFALTNAQKRVIDEIQHDMAVPHPMHRLVQGDVGSGKTVVALYAAAVAVENDYQAALMAPTELLAEQHWETIRRLAAAVGLRVTLLTGAVTGKLRGRTERAIARGDIDLVIGTHALIQERVEFHRLGVGIIDEQHRFGVMQRATLKRHGTNPDILLMTATPIPRTLALTLYGDLDVSVLDELPPGRRPVVTRVYPQTQRARVLETVRRELDAGRQAYIVCPLVAESEKSELLDATKAARELAAGPLADYRLALVHGQMRAEEKDDVMRRFKSGEHQVLVSTTVIEVGIDVPNATVMIVEHAECFGLAQLHQLRGRVGRGAHRSLCFLLASYARGDQARERLRVMEETNDGFRIAEKDLELRGPGEFLGTRQSGLPDFRAASILRDGALLHAAQEDAAEWLRRDPDLRTPESLALRDVLEERWSGRLELARVG